MPFNLIAQILLSGAVGFGVWFIQNRLESIERAQDRLHDDRRTIYMNLLAPIIHAWAGIKNPKESRKALDIIRSADYRKTAFEFSMIGSDDVVRSFNNMMQYLYSCDAYADTKPAPEILFMLLGDVLLSIRQNLGNPDTALTQVDMLRSMISDIDAVLGAGD